jgi:putative intracellular protease/amidase
VVVAGNHATEISDPLGPYETLATSGTYNVFVAAPERVASPFFPGSLSVVPHYSFSEYDAAFSGAVDLLVVPYIPNASTSDAAVLDWIREKAALGTTVLSICAGAQVVADAGVLGGQSATTHHDTLPVVERSHPEVQWVQGKRWVDSGQFISSAGITSGVDATLHTLDRFFGRQVAEQTAQAMGYSHAHFLNDPTWTVPTPNPLPLLVDMYRWNWSDVGMLVYDGMREVELSSILDTYPRSGATTVHPLGAHAGVLRTVHGLNLVGAEDLANAPSPSRLLLPGTADANTARLVDRWAADWGPTAERIHASGAYAYDATLTDMANDDSNVIVRETGIGLEYPTQSLALSGPEWRADLIARPLAPGLIGLGALVLVRRERASRGSHHGNDDAILQPTATKGHL